MEKIPVKIYKDSKQACQNVANEIRQLIENNNAADKSTVLGLATGGTPIGVYEALIRLHKQEGLDFSKVITFNLDEYWPMDPNRIQSYHYWMWANLFEHINIPKDNVHIPSGTVSEDQVESYCADYEIQIAEAGGIDFQILGIGRSGHIGFNEPGSPKDSVTRRIILDRITRKDAASDFFGEEHVPKMALTMGVGTILKARRIALLAFGEHKAPVIKMATEGDVSSEIAASFLQEHENAMLFLDEAAAGKLTRMTEPWMIESCRWDDILERQAVIWLAEKTQKPLLKLTQEDYTENHLGELIRQRGRAYDINLRVFRRMMNTITGWPGGKDGPMRALILSPHPDDDVICMGGTMSRLAEQGHDVHTAYMVSGYLSVFDHNVLRHADFVAKYNQIFNLSHKQTDVIETHIENFLRGKTPGDVDTQEIRAIKGLIRRTEALAAAAYCGLDESQVHFLDMPFYDTGTVQKHSISQADIDAVFKLLETVKPEMIFAAGDLSDPHGTHRLCLTAFLEALETYCKKSKTEPVLYLYRGAWDEWLPYQIDMAVPLSPDELRRKRYSIFRHESQKDRAMFPGPFDEREFWKRAEDRNMATAQTYDALGLPEYHAVEAFVKWPLIQSAQQTAQLENED